MFTKEKLEKWIGNLHDVLYGLPLDIDEERWHNLADLEKTLEQIYTSMTSDNSI